MIRSGLAMAHNMNIIQDSESASIHILRMDLNVNKLHYLQEDTNLVHLSSGIFSSLDISHLTILLLVEYLD